MHEVWSHFCAGKVQAYHKQKGLHQPNASMLALVVAGCLHGVSIAAVSVCKSGMSRLVSNQSKYTYSTRGCTKNRVTFACPVLGYHESCFTIMFLATRDALVINGRSRFFLLPRNWFQARPSDIMNQTKTQKFEKFLRSGTSFDTHLAYHHVESVTASSTVPSDYAFVISHVVYGWTDTPHLAWCGWQFGRFACFLLAAYLKAAEIHQIERSIAKWTSDTKWKSENVWKCHSSR